MNHSQEIKRIEIIPFDIPYKKPFRVSLGGVIPGNFVVIRILTNEGVEGIGSSRGFPSRNGQTRESAMALMKNIASEVLLGQNPLNTDLLLSNVEGRVAQDWQVLAHFDYALYDLKGRILNVPVYQLLGGLCREKIPLECIVMMDEPEVQAEVALEYINAGFHSIKMHVGPDPKLAVKRFKAVRKAVGDDIPIAIDMTGVYGARDALRLIEELVQYDLNFAEDPCTRYDIEGLVDIRRRTNVPLVADLIAPSINEARNVIKRRAADSFHTLLNKVGGIRRATKYTTLIEAEDLDYQICTLGTGIEHAAGAHFAISRTKKERLNDELGLILYLHGGTETQGITSDITKRINGKIQHGYLYPPEGPGLGIELNEEMIKKYAVSDVNSIIVE
jgi:L-alanine-DL-glutamate epimerase-like enolase superfamily enzyme